MSFNYDPSSLTSSMGAGGGNQQQVDPALVQFIETEAQRQQFQTLVHVLTDSCWDVCLPDKLGSKLDGKTETCLTNCVNRFIDASNFIVTRLEEVRQKELTKADVCYYSGKSLNALSEYDPKCEEHLSRAVKLNPTSIDAANELGLCLWKKSDMAGAKNCFETALEKNRNKVSLRSLSIIYRHETSPNDAQSPSTTKDCTKLRDVFERCLNMAKDAADLDPADGYSWYLVGNGYLTAFFGFAQCRGDYIRSAMESYAKALEDEDQQFSPELYLNRGIALKYEEDYSLALRSLERATLLDPFFESAKVDLQNLTTYLDRIQDCASKKGKIKAKRLQEMCSSMCRQVDLGPYGGDYRTKTAGGASVELKYTHLKDLRCGRNDYAVVLLKVVGIVVNDDTIPYTFCCVDEIGTCTAVTVYNFSQRFGVVIGNTVAILEPFYALMDFEFRGKKYAFSSIRVPTPEIMVVNRKKLGSENCAVANVALSRE